MPVSHELTFGEKIKQLRTAKGESLQSVADAAGISKAHIWELERGRAKNPTVSTVKTLAAYFGADYADLISYMGED